MTTNQPTWLRVYQRWILQNPRATLAVLALVVLSFSFFARDFRLDASSDSLTLENDEDLLYYEQVIERFDASEFVFITFTPRGRDLFSQPVLEEIKSLREELKKMERVSSVVSLLDVPLLKNPPGPLADLSRNTKTLESAQADLEMARTEFLTSPIYRHLLVSEDGKSTALQVNFKANQEHKKVLDRRSALRDLRLSGQGLSPEQQQESELIEQKHREFKDLAGIHRTQDIAFIRQLVDRYRGENEIFLGGVPMIVDDILSFIRDDLLFFGLGMIVFLVAALAMIFRRRRWVILPLSCCAISALLMIGLLGFLQWDVTVVSSNFVSLQLIFTMSLAIHIVVRYRELLREGPDRSQMELVAEAVRHTFIPCFYASMTTIAGFTSLVVSNILPVVNFGWMMTLGLCISLSVTFLLMPAVLVLLKKPEAVSEKDFGLPLTHLFARWTEKRGPVILVMAGIFTITTLWGSLRLEVENSFIDYFKKSTEIYQGMKFIDDHLGGTTPLDVMITFSDGRVSESTDSAENDDPSEELDEFDEFSDFDDEFADSEKYWFTQDKFERMNEIHDYLESLTATGKVLSLATLEKTVRDLNNDQPLDNFTLALLFNELDDVTMGTLVDPFVDLEKSQARFTARIKDSLPGLRRNQLIEKIETDLAEKFSLKEDEFRVTGLMVLYNNMLQSLFDSQITTIGYTLLALLIMFFLLFRSVKVALIATFPSLLSSLSALGFMGLLGIPLDIMTITIVAISIGIAVDDTIHYLHRFKKELAVDQDYVGAMHRSHGSIGNAMYYTSLTITIGFSFLAASSFIPTILFGIFTALVMIMALVASLTLMPRLILHFRPFS